MEGEREDGEEEGDRRGWRRWRGKGGGDEGRRGIGERCRKMKEKGREGGIKGRESRRNKIRRWRGMRMNTKKGMGRKRRRGG